MAQAFGYDDEILADLSRTAVDASFAPAATKERLHRETDAWLDNAVVVDRDGGPR